MDGVVSGTAVPDVGEWQVALAAWVTSARSDATRVDAIAALERIKSTCCALQAELAADLYESVRQSAVERCRRSGERFEDAVVRRSVGQQVGLARRESPDAGRQHLNLACALTVLPAIRDCLRRGDTDEYRATLVARELGCLSEADRVKADTLVAERLPRLGCRSARNHAAAVAARLDQEAVLAKIRAAVKGRHVSIRALPDTMVRLSAVLPLAVGVAAFASLRAHCDRVAAGGDPVKRGRGQLMADEFAARVLGTARQSDADGMVAGIGNDSASGASGGRAAGVGVTGRGSGDTRAADDDAAGVDDYGLPARAGSVELQLIMTDRALFDGDDEPAVVSGHGPVPAALARRLVGHRAARVFVRRLFCDPRTRALTGADRRARLFPDAVRRFLLARDQVCRTPWCDAPIRHGDHVVAHRAGGATEADNAQGLCESCNYLKEAPGWRAEPGQDTAVVVTAPTGHAYLSRPPEPPWSQSWSD